MKKFGIALLASALLFSGCELLNKKEDEGQGGAQQGGGAAAVDPSTYTTANGPVMGIPSEGIKVGMKVTVETKAGGQTTTYTAAIVGEEGDNWLIESGQLVASSNKDYLVGMVVSKKDGMIQSAVCGKKGETPKTIKHQNMKPAAATGGKAATPAVVDCKIALGTFKAYMSDAGGTKVWTGSEGDMQGVLLKMESAQGGKELKAKPEMVELDLGGTKVKAKKLVWDNGDVQTTTDNATVKLLNYGMVENTNQYSSSKVTAVASDAAPELKWDAK